MNNTNQKHEKKNEIDELIKTEKLITDMKIFQNQQQNIEIIKSHL